MDVPVIFKVDLPAVQRLLEAAFSVPLVSTSLPAREAASTVVGGGMVTVFAPSRNNGNRRVAYGFSLATIQRGLAILFTKYPAYITGVMSSQAPGPVLGHVVMQCCLYGEVLEQYSLPSVPPALPVPAPEQVVSDDPEYALFFV